MTQIHPAAAEMAHIPEWEMVDELPHVNDSGFSYHQAYSHHEAPTLYLSGPMSGYVGHNFEVFARAKHYLLKLGYGVESPADHGYVEGWD